MLKPKKEIKESGIKRDYLSFKRATSNKTVKGKNFSTLKTSKSNLPHTLLCKIKSDPKRVKMFRASSNLTNKNSYGPKTKKQLKNKESKSYRLNRTFKQVFSNMNTPKSIQPVNEQTDELAEVDLFNTRVEPNNKNLKSYKYSYSDLRKTKHSPDIKNLYESQSHFRSLKSDLNNKKNNILIDRIQNKIQKKWSDDILKTKLSIEEKDEFLEEESRYKNNYLKKKNFINQILGHVDSVILLLILANLKNGNSKYFS